MLKKNFNMTENFDPSVKITGIYIGDRGIAFKSLIISLLKKGNIKDKYINILTDKDSMEIFSSVFTSEQVDEKNNYQVYEQLGDLTGNKFIVWYIYRRFPQLKCAEGVKVAARLRINLGSKNSFCQIAEKYGFWEFITATNELRQRKKKPLLEDVFEAFIGATELILDTKTKTGVGYACVFKILSNIFDDMNISLKYEDLYDAKTRLKELFDIFVEEIGPLVYEEHRKELLSFTSIYRLHGAKFEIKSDGSVNTNKIIGNYRKILIGEGSAALKADSEQVAALNALKKMESEGYIKHPPAIYAKFVDNKIITKPTTKCDIIKIIGNEKEINGLFQTKKKSVYQNKYLSTVLTMYCRKRDSIGVLTCLDMGADPNIKDSDGMTCLDILMIGQKEVEHIAAILDLFSGRNIVLDIHENIFKAYFRDYGFSKVYRINIIFT